MGAHRHDRHNISSPTAAANPALTGRSMPERKPLLIRHALMAHKHSQSKAVPEAQASQSPRHCRIIESDSFHGLQERWS